MASRLQFPDVSIVRLSLTFHHSRPGEIEECSPRVDPLRGFRKPFKTDPDLRSLLSGESAAEIVTRPADAENRTGPSQVTMSN
jgi:hypothetical protein